MSTNLEKLKVSIRELLKKELEEASVTGGIDGGEGPPKTPFAFTAGRKKDKKKRNRIAKQSGLNYVQEGKFHVRTTIGSVIVDAGSAGVAKMMVAKALKGGAKNVLSVNRVGVSKAKQVDKKLESTNEGGPGSGKPKDDSWDDEEGRAVPKGKKDADIGWEDDEEAKRQAMKDMGIEDDDMFESVNEGKYHDYRNDESLTSKQKIGYSMREVRDKLNELDKLVKMNVRLKNEIGVDSTSYWKNTHRAMNKISERLVKLANKVGQLY